MHSLSRSSFVRFGLLALFSGLSHLLCGRVDATDEAGALPTANRLATLARGFNLDHCRQHGLSDGFYKPETLQTYQSLGLSHTRLPILLSDFLNDDHPDRLKTESLAALDAMVQMHLETGMAVIVSPFDPPDELYSNPDLLAKFVTFFKAFATHLSSTDPEKVFLEVMNEPSAATPQIWDRVQAGLVTAIRSGAPNHTIIASSNLRVTERDWSNIRALPMTRVLADKNVVYNFHFYEPFVFTHQGATWGWPALKFMKDIPYPSTLETVASSLSTIQNPEAKQAIESYGKENWNRDKLIQALSIAANWARINKIPISCNEFGVIPWTAPREDRLRYLKDVREALEFHKIAWSQWFGLDVQDSELIQVLGLSPLPRS